MPSTESSVVMIVRQTTWTLDSIRDRHKHETLNNPCATHDTHKSLNQSIHSLWGFLNKDSPKQVPDRAMGYIL